MLNQVQQSPSQINYSTLKDYDLVYRFKNNDQKAAELLLKKYAGLLKNNSVQKFNQYRFVNSLEFDDAQQDMYLCFFEALNDINLEKVYNKETFNIYAHFVQRICRYNDMAIRKINNYKEFQEKKVEEYYLKEVSKSSIAEMDLKLLIEDIKALLSETEKEVFELHISGYTPDEIGKILVNNQGVGISRHGIYYYTRNIRKKIKENFEF